MILFEIVIILFIIFIISPKNSINLIRQAGRLVGKLKKLLNELKTYSEDFNIMKMDDENGSTDLRLSQPSNRGQNPNIGHNPADSKVTKSLLLELAEMHFDLNMSKTIIMFLFDDDRYIIDKAYSLLMRDPLLSFSKHNSYVGNKNNDYKFYSDAEYFNEAFSNKRILDITKSLIGIPSFQFTRALGIISTVPGIENLDLNAVFTKEKSKDFPKFKELRKEFTQKYYNNNGYIYTENRCNSNCYNCFTNDNNTHFDSVMSKEDFRCNILRLKEDYKISSYTLLGTEPLVSDNILDYADVLLEENLNMNLVTKALVSTDLWKQVLEYNNLKRVIIQINKESNSNEFFLNNIKLAVKNNKHIEFRLNITNTNNDWSYLYDLINIVTEFNLSFEINIDKKKEINLTDFTIFGHSITSLIDFVQNNCNNKNFNLILAKPIPLCVFTKDQYIKILENVLFTNVCSLDKNNRTNKLIINPDGSFNPCSGLNSSNFNFKFSTTSNSLPSNYFMKVDRVLKKPMFDKCKECYLFGFGVCQGLCYSYLN